MTPILYPDEPPPLRGGLFRAGEHVAVVCSGSVIAILDLERGTFYAATPEAADAWAALVEGRTPYGGAGREGSRAPAPEQGAADSAAVLARIAGYLLEQRLIEPSDRGGAERR
jgi:hypothetical protein